MISLFTSSKEQTELFAARLAAVIEKGIVIHLQGDLGAGKTTFARGFLHGLGHQGAVKSPTYNIVQDYQIGDLTVHHFDLYRIACIDELEALGFRDYFDGQSLCLLEWPEKGEGLLPSADLEINLIYVDEGRKIDIAVNSNLGQKSINSLNY